jgi:hypothetical protein
MVAAFGSLDYLLDQILAIPTGQKVIITDRSRARSMCNITAAPVLDEGVK